MSSRFLVIGQRYQRVEPVLVDVLEAGYVWDDRALSGNRQMRQPRKDGYYDHSMNCCEYLDLRFGPRQTTDETLAELPEEEPFDRFRRRNYGADEWMR